jgi:acyl carrier protein
MEKFVSNLEEILELDLGIIKEDDNFKEFEEWDSISSLAVLSMINEEYDITIPRAEFDNLITVGDLYNYIQSKK